MASNVVPMPGQGAKARSKAKAKTKNDAQPKQDAKARADAETEDKRRLYDWADQLLERIGVAKKVAAATSIDDLNKIEFDADSVDVVIAIRDALQPRSGKCPRHFLYLKVDTLKRVLKMRFDEMKHYAEMKLKRGQTTNEQYASNVCLPDVIQTVIDEYLDMKPHESVASTLWSLHTHVYDRFMISPRLALKSKRKGCGKTTTLDVQAVLSARGKRVDNTTAASLYRGIDRNHPSLMIDEGDNLDIRGAIRSIMNSGHRKLGCVERVIDGELRDFSTFGPMAVGVIGTLPEELLDRSIIINLRETERTDLRRFNIDDPHIKDVVKPIYRQMCAWAQSKPALNPNPDLPAKLRTRVSDNWLVLISIADCFGEEWGKKARDAAEIFLRDIKNEDLGFVMLVSARKVFADTDRCSVDEFVKALHNLHDAPWNEYCGGHGGKGVPHRIRAAEVTALLDKYDIGPGTVCPKERDAESKSFRGYMASWFEDAWARHCNDDDEVK